MEVKYLKEFIVLAQTGNFLEAADVLHSSQSALSKHLKTIEAELGVILFDRTTRKVSLSKYGQLLLPYARQIVEIHTHSLDILHNSAETDRDTLTIGSIPALAQYKITDVLISFKKTRPQSTLNVIQADLDDLAEMLRREKCELAFIRDIEDVKDEFVKMPYASDAIVAVLPITHPLARRKTIPLQILAEENFLLTKPQTLPYHLSVRACAESGFEPKIAFTDHSLENLVDLVAKGMGVSLALKQMVLYLANPKIAIVDVSPRVTTQVSLCYINGAKLSEAAKHFVLCAGSQ